MKEEENTETAVIITEIILSAALFILVVFAFILASHLAVPRSGRRAGGGKTFENGVSEAEREEEKRIAEAIRSIQSYDYETAKSRVREHD